MFKAILLSSLCSLLLLQAKDRETLICAKDIFTEQEATAPSSLDQNTNSSKKKKNSSSQSVPKPNADENATAPTLLNPEAEKEIFQDE